MKKQLIICKNKDEKGKTCNNEITTEKNEGDVQCRKCGKRTRL